MELVAPLVDAPGIEPESGWLYRVAPDAHPSKSSAPALPCHCVTQAAFSLAPHSLDVATTTSGDSLEPSQAGWINLNRKPAGAETGVDWRGRYL